MQKLISQVEPIACALAQETSISKVYQKLCELNETPCYPSFENLALNDQRQVIDFYQLVIFYLIMKLAQMAQIEVFIEGIKNF